MSRLEKEIMEVNIMKSIMRYKGYWAEVRYSDEDECFWGKIEGLKNTSISFEGNTVKELNKKKEKQCKGSLNVRLGVELHNKAKMKSIEQNISINELIKNAVVAYLKTN